MAKDNNPKTGDRPPITAEDLELLATPDEQLRDQAFVFSFDLDKAEERVKSGDEWQQIVQAHLHLDHVVTLFLSEELKRPDVINIDRMAFLQKLQLAQAMGLLPDEVVSTVEQVNALRNLIVHNLNFNLTKKEVKDLANATPKYLRDAALKEKGREKGPIRLWEILYVLIVQLEVYRQGRVYHRLMETKGHIRLRTVLEKTEGAVYRK